MSKIYAVESLFGLAYIFYSLKRYETARGYSEELLMLHPDSAQAQDIHKAIVYKQNRQNQKTQDTVLWTTVGVGIAALAAFAVTKAMKK